MLFFFFFFVIYCKNLVTISEPKMEWEAGQVYSQNKVGDKAKLK